MKNIHLECQQSNLKIGKLPRWVHPSSKECATNQMAKLVEQSDLGHWEQLPVGEVTGSAHLENKDDSIHESEPKIIKSGSAEESPGVKIGLEYQVTHSQTIENLQDNSIPDCKVKDKDVYIPPHRRSDGDWQEHAKNGFKGPQGNVKYKGHMRSGEYSDYHGTPPVHDIGSCQDLGKTEDKHSISLSKDIPGKRDANTCLDSGSSLMKSTQSVGFKWIWIV